MNEMILLMLVQTICGYPPPADEKPIIVKSYVECRKEVAICVASRGVQGCTGHKYRQWLDGRKR